MKQSWGPREMREGTLNADGYGFGWYGRNNKPHRYVSPFPIWTDPNLASLAQTLAATLWMANVRSATRTTDVSYANTQPFHDEHFFFLHNGYISNFPEQHRFDLRRRLDRDIESRLEGSTDSEHLFAVVRQLYKDQPDSIEKAFFNLFSFLDNQLGSDRSLLNIVLSNTDSIYATRHAINGEPPSLYYSTEEPDYPGGQLIASEPLTRSGRWQSVPENHLVILRRDSDPELLAIFRS